MALECKTGNFVKKTDGTGTQAVTGVGFVPDLIIFFSTGKATTDSWSEDLFAMLGMATSTSNERSVSGSADAGNPTRDVACRNHTGVITFVIFNQTIAAEADLNSFDSDGFTLDWTTNEGTATIIHYMALKGADITNSQIIEWSTGTSATTVTATGAGFTPTLAIHFWGGREATAASDTGANFDFGIGCMDGTNQWAVSNVMNEGGSSRSKRYSTATAAIAGADWGAGDIIVADFDSFNSDGFVVDVTTAPADAIQVMSLCLSGVTSFIGVEVKDTDTGADAVTGVGFEPIGLLLAGANQTSDGAAADASFSMGVTDGTSEEAMAWSNDESATNDTTQALDSTTKVYVNDELGSGSSNATADFTSFDSDGFTLNWATNEAQADRIHYLAFGSVPTPADEITAVLGSMSQPQAEEDFQPIGYKVGGTGS